MQIGNMLELILTLFAFVLIWGLPKIIAQAAKKRQQQKAGRSSIRRAVKAEMMEAVPLPAGHGETRSMLTGGEVFQQQLTPASPAAVSRPAAGRRRTPLQQAVIWKEILDLPKALRDDPFGSTLK